MKKTTTDKKLLNCLSYFDVNNIRAFVKYGGLVIKRSTRRQIGNSCSTLQWPLNIVTVAEIEFSQ